MTIRFRLGLLINPLAGLGGSVALKGSDGVADEAIAKGAQPKSHLRMKQALEVIRPYRHEIEIMTASGLMGESLALEMGFDVRVVHHVNQETGAVDTQAVVKKLLDETLDLLLFAGGDGTARDIYHVAGDTLPVLGVPAGVKIHSGVYGITPHAAGTVVKMLLEGELVSLMNADVMDIDEVAFRQGTVKARRYGEMQVPAEPRFIQSVKMGGVEVDELVLLDIAAEVLDNMDDELYIMGSGTTVAAVMDELQLDNTLLGVDLVQNRELIAADLSAQQLLEQTLDQSVKLVITLIGGQGHILGRGNQQLSSELIKRVGKDNIIILATKTKLKALEGRPLIVDSGDPELDRDLCGYYRVITGFHDHVMYQVANPDLM
ncbi:ATP-NAD kinase family protein [Shewanella sp. VB17]|uniref:ATP-NAD kinase family protein n=1 Tax=Shewanella sp. VB17 TaxID=2739432 RepID=UPI00156475D2|nr:ATP-NAD kinase family protein [Shewanella sp. VB17]NRD74367.1 ATP-NAD kinase family protein [Shewanella sp. VB17]